MKKFSPLFKIMLVAVIAVTMFSCKKEQTTLDTTQGEATLARIMDFKQKVEAYQMNPAMKSGATISLAEAIWNIENLFNLTYAKPEDAYSETSEFVFSLYLPVDAQGNVLETDLFCLYEQVKALARTNYANTDFVNKGFLFMTVELGEQIDGFARIDFRGKAGERCEQPHYHDTAIYLGPFTTDDNWKYADGLGNCEGNILVSGADKEIERQLRNYLAATADKPEGANRAVYVNPVIIEFDGYQYPNDVYYQTDVSNPCIDHNNMNRLYQREKRLVFMNIPNNPSSPVYGYLPVFIELQGEAVPETNPNYFTHHNRVIYGQRILANITTIGEVCDLLND